MVGNFGFGTGSISNRFQSPYQFRAGKPNQENADALWQALQTYNKTQGGQIVEERSMWDRASDALQTGNYAAANYASDWVKLFKGDEDASLFKAINPLDDVLSGLKAGFIFGKGSEKDEKTFSNVIGEIGWNPESFGGKAVKGTLGFVGDVLLDPLTYVTGGLSAALKGTGRVGKAASALTELSTKYNGGEKMLKMTDDVAEKIIRDSDTFKYQPVSNEQLGLDVKQFTRNFNKQAGLRDSTPITIGIANLPFGDKLASKMGVLGKTRTISSGDGLRKFADTVGSAKAYAGVRNQVYGSKIGKMFSNNHILHKQAIKDPAKLYESLSFMNLTQGQNLSKLEAEQLIRQRYDEIGTFSKSEQKEMIKLLENKSAWVKVQKVLKFADSEESKRLRKEVELDKEKLFESLDSMTKLRNIADDMAKVDKADLTKLELEDMQHAYRKELMDFDTTAVKHNKRLYEEYRGLVQKEIGDTDNLIKNVDGSVLQGRTGNDSIETLSKLMDDVMNESDLSAVTQKLSFSRNKGEKVVHADKHTGKAKVVNEGTNIDKVQTESISLVEREKMFEALSEVAYGHPNGFNVRSDRFILDNTFPVIEAVKSFKGSTDHTSVMKFVSDNKGFFGKATPEQAGKFGEMLVKGDFQSLFQDFLHRNPKYTSEHSKEVWKHLAESIGYRNFLEDVDAPLQRLIREKNENPGSFTAKKEEYMNQLLLKTEMRRNGVDKYLKNMSEDEFRAFRKEYQSRTMRDQYEESLELDTKRFEVPDTEGVLFESKGKTPTTKSNGNGQTVEEYLNTPLEKLIEMEKIKRKGKNPKVTVADLRTDKNGSIIKNRVEAYFLQNMMKKGMSAEKAAEALAKTPYRVDSTMRDVAKVMYQKHPNMNFYDLMDSDIKKLIGQTQAMGHKNKWKLNARIIREELGLQEKVDKVIGKAERTKTVKDSLYHGRTVRATVDDVEYEGAISAISSMDGKTTYTMRSGDKTIEFRPFHVTSFDAGVRDKTMREVMAENERVKELVEIRTASQKKLDELTVESAEKLTPEQTNARALLVAEQKAKVNKAKGQVEAMEKKSLEARARIEKELEMSVDKARNEIFSGDYIKALDDSLDKLDARINKIDDALKSDEAFEEFSRIKYGNKQIDRAVLHESGYNDKSFEFALKENASTKEVTEFTEFLRESFNNAGRTEVSFSKLTNRQFEAMMDNYVPHVPTEDGVRYFNSMKEITEHSATITEDFGFGTKWNPFASSRTIEGKSIDEINEQFHKVLKGKNLFSDNVADIYLARMMKHEELRYDQQYMQNMMQRFGREIKGGVIDKGYEGVANYGILRKHFSDEASMIMSQRMSELRKQGRNMDLTKEQSMEMFEEIVTDVIEKYGFDPKVMDKFATPMVELTAKQIEKLSGTGVAKQVSDSIVQKANQSRKLAIAKDEHLSLQMYDKFLHFMKLQQTVVVPSFTLRNQYSNMFQSWLGIGRDAFNVKFQKNALTAVRARGDVEKLRAMPPLILDDGSVMRWDQIWAEAVSHQAVDEGFFAKDIGAGAVTSGLFKNKIPAKWNPTDTGNFAPYKIGTEIGSAIENMGRLTHFASMRKQGYDALESAESSIKYLFDYSDLTAFEQSTMKRIFPFYTWMRKNMRLQASELIEQPDKYAMVPKIQNGLEGGNSEEDKVSQRYLQDFVRDWVQTPMSLSKKGPDGEVQGKDPIMMNPNLPFMDVAGMPDPFNAKDSLREFFSQTAPLIKVPIEQMMNKNSYFDSEIVREGESQLGKRAEHIGGQFALINATTGALNRDPRKGALHLLGTLTGVKLSAYDYERGKDEQMRDALWEDGESNAISGFLEKAGEFISGVTTVSKGLAASSLMMVAGAPPKGPGDYGDALMPISKHAYDALSKEEKVKYTPPTEDEVTAYHKRAVELSQQAYQENGKIKQFAWTLLDKVNDREEAVMGYVTDVVDGDTFKVKLGDEEVKIRPLLIDAPETTKKHKEDPMPFGTEATEYANDLLFGKDVRLITDGEDNYGRTLAFIEVDGSDYNRKMIEEGLAKVAYLFGREGETVDDYYDAEDEAFKKKKGIWSKPGYATPGVDNGYNWNP